ncbi:MAG: hypothetical protein KF841_07500 [Phycisphaerae bacterium]|nr:hypothetical protein [Phycisphaerae bacterium]
MRSRDWLLEFEAMFETNPALPFVLDAVGVFPPSHVHVTTVDEPRPTTPELERLIAVEWERRIREAKANNRLLFNGPMLRYVSHAMRREESGEAHFDLTVGPTCYRDFVGTNLFNHHRLREFGWSRFSNPIGTTATIMTGDDLICYGVRSSRVSYHASHVHTFGGSFEQRDRRPDGTVDPFGSLTREITEELGLASDELHDLVCVGLLRDREIHQPEMLFETRVALSAEELRTRWESAESRDEHDGLVTLRNAPEEIVPFIQTCGQIAPVAIGALMLHGRLSWGHAWFDEASRRLCGR